MTHCAAKLISDICANEWTEDELKKYIVKLEDDTHAFVDENDGVHLYVVEKILNEAGKKKF